MDPNSESHRRRAGRTFVDERDPVEASVEPRPSPRTFFVQVLPSHRVMSWFKKVCEAQVIGIYVRATSNHKWQTRERGHRKEKKTQAIANYRSMIR